VRTSPNDPYVLSYHAFLLSTRNETRQSIEFGRKAVRLDPASIRTPFRNILATVFVHAGRYREAVDLFRENARRGNPVSRVTLTHFATALAGLDRLAEAHAALERAEQFPPFPWSYWLPTTYTNETVKRRFIRPLDRLGHQLS